MREVPIPLIADGTDSVGVAVAFGAGVLSFLSPCVLPLVPSYVTFITGMTVDEASSTRRIAVVHALLFTLGFTLIFLALGASASALGRVLLVGRGWIARVGGVVIILFGLYMLGLLRIPGLGAERRIHFATKPVGYLGSLLVGVAFGAGWTPCIGPILGSILIYTSATASLPRGLLLLSAYSLGLAVPFLLAALALDRFLAAYARARGVVVWANRIGGVVLVVVGLLLATNYFTLLAALLQDLTPAALRSRI